MDQKQSQHFMGIAIVAAAEGATPYGCVIVNKNTQEYLVACNLTKSEGKTAHAEMQALRELNSRDWDPADLVMVTTGEPCPMCMGAIIWCGVKQIVYGLSIDKISKYHNQIMLNAQEVINASWQEIDIVGPVKEQECIALFEKFS